MTSATMPASAIRGPADDVSHRRKTGRPRRGEEPSLDRKLFFARELLVSRAPVSNLCLLGGHSSATIYRWVRDVCNSDHETAEVLRPLAEKRGLL